MSSGRYELLRPRLIDEIFSGWESLGSLAWGMYCAINCQNDFPAIAHELLEIQSADYPLLEGHIRHAREIEICALWDLPAVPFDAEPVVSDIPTLVLTDGLDPITPPEWGRNTAENILLAYHFEFATARHGVAGEST